MQSITWAQVAALRMRRQHLLEPAPHARLVDVVRDHVGIQAQVMSSAELSLRARVTSVRRPDVGAALWDERTLVKTWAMRGTIHLLAAEDLPLVVAARCADGGRFRLHDFLQLGFTEAQYDEFLLAATAQNLRRMAKRLFEKQQTAAEVPI